MTMTATTGGAIRDEYEQKGWVIARNVLDADLIGEAKNHVEWLLKKHPDLRGEQLGHTLITDDPFWVRLVGDDRLLDVAEQFIGPNIALFASHYIAKPPFDGQPVLWHQDGAYWPLKPMNVVTLWLAVDDATPENGCMRVIPGTHKMELQQLQERKDIANVLNSQIDPKLVDESKAVDVILNAGDVSIHHPNIIHGSEANLSAKWRRGLTIRYIPTSTRITAVKPGEKWASAFLLRGDAVPDVNEYNPKPTFDASKHMRFAGAEQFGK